MKRVLKLLVFLYLFVFAIEIIKDSALALAPSITSLLNNGLGPIKAVSAGWFATSVVQSSGAVDSVAATLVGSDILPLETGVYMLIGASLGTTITAVIISIITASKEQKDFRHGFEIGLSYTIYSAILVLLAFTLEYFFAAFSRISFAAASFLQPGNVALAVPDVVHSMTAPILTPLRVVVSSDIAALLLGFITLIFALKFIGSSVIEVFGGEEKTREFINKHFDSRLKAYLIGVIITAIVFSSSITIGLLVPLATARVIRLRQAIPFILGADLGTFTDVLLASLVVGDVSALALAIASFLFAFLGALIFLPNVWFLNNLTKKMSKGVLAISRQRAIYFLLGFVLLPLAVLLT